MRKSTVLFVIFVAFLSIAQQQCGDGNNTPTNTNPFQGGTRGLSIQFSDQAPPDEVFDLDHPFPVEVKLENQGEFTVPGALVKVTLDGVNPVDFGRTESDFIKNGIDQDVTATIIDSEGNEIDAPPVFVTFPLLQFQKALPGNNQFPIRASVCYRYQTQAFADGCIKSDVLSRDENSVCVVHEGKTVFNSGAPIQVDSFTEQPSGSDKVRYVFKVKHVGSGNFFKPRDNNRCPSNVYENRLVKDFVHFKIESQLQDKLRCTFSGGTGLQGNLRLTNGEATVYCDQTVTSNIDFVDKIHITLKYDYEETIRETILVKKSTLQ